MNEENSAQEQSASLPQAQIKLGRSFSVIWVVPLLTLFLGGWLVYEAVSEKGPTITISFENANGLVAGTTLIKFKDVEVGKVTKIELNEDLSRVVVTAEMHKSVTPYMTENTHFWVVRARVAAGEVSGLGTLFSGAYIGCNPSAEGRRKNQFIGLDKPPALTTGQPGRQFILAAENLGSLDLGSPVYYRGIKVGQVVEYNFDTQGEAILIKVFIYAPHDAKVRRNTRFWNSSGIDFSVDASGVKMKTQSLVSIMLGGVAFDLDPYARPQAQAEENEKFVLFPDQEKSTANSNATKHYYRLYFDQSVRGLLPGAPVEIKGIKIGEVVKIELQFDPRRLDFQVPVLVALESKRLRSLLQSDADLNPPPKLLLSAGQSGSDDLVNRLQPLIEKGYRAQLKPGNLLTGQLYIDLAYYPDAAAVEGGNPSDYPVIPTLSAPLEQVAQRVDTILKKIETIAFDDIGAELQTSMEELSAVLKHVKKTANSVNREMIPAVDTALSQLQKTLSGIDASLGPDSGLSYNATTAAAELTMTLRSLRTVLDNLERDPQALIFGREKAKK